MSATVRTFDIPIDDKGHVVPIQIHEPARKVQNLGLSTWGSSLVLANRLHLVSPVPGQHELQNGQDEINVLEVGAGTGLVGLSAAAIWHAQVVLTDLVPVVPNLAANIALNRNILSNTGGRCWCGSLDWADAKALSPYAGQGETDVPQPRFDKARVILAADTVYSDDHPEILSQVILSWLSRSPGARALIAYPLRVAYLDQIREFWHLLEEGGLQAVEEGKAEVGDEWDDEKSHEWSVWAWRDLTPP